MRIRQSVLPILAAGLVSICAAPAIAAPNGGGNSGNDDIFAPSGGTATSFTVVFSGDMLPELGIPASQGNSGTIYVPQWGDPFCATPSGSCAVTATYNPSTGDTSLVYSGTQGLFQNSQEANYYHFGYVLANACVGTGCDIYVGGFVNTYWTYAVGSQFKNINVGFASVKCSCKLNAKKTLVAIVYYEATILKEKLPVQAWTAVRYTPVPGEAQPTIVFRNYEGQSLQIMASGIVTGIKEPTSYDGWQALVGMMNFENMPPPGASGSPFGPLQKAPPKILKPEPVKAAGILETGRWFKR
jgi:hypothetical protein